MLICLSGQLEDPRTRCDIFKEQSDKDVSVVYGKLPFPALPHFLCRPWTLGYTRICKGIERRYLRVGGNRISVLIAVYLTSAFSPNNLQNSFREHEKGRWWVLNLMYLRNDLYQVVLNGFGVPFKHWAVQKMVPQFQIRSWVVAGCIRVSIEQIVA